MKILSITSLFPNREQPNRGVFVLNRIRAMNKKADLEVIAPVAYFPFISHNRPRNVPDVESIDGLVVYHPRFISIPAVFKFLDGWFFYLCLRRYRKEIMQADIVDSHFGWPYGYGSYLFARKYKKKLSVTLRGRDVTYWQKRPLIRRRFKKMLEYSSLIISVSDGLKEKADTNKRIVVIPNGVDTTRFGEHDKEVARERLKLPLDGKIFLTVGNDFKRKGFFELVDAFKELDVENKRLLIIGKGTDFVRLENRIGDRSDIELLGEIDNRELVHYYSACDVYCLVSYSEGWPNSVMEALACVKPCVVTKEAAGEIINEDLGIVTDHENLAASLKRAVEKTWDPMPIRDYIRGRSWERTADEVLSQFAGLMRNH